MGELLQYSGISQKIKVALILGPRSIRVSHILLYEDGDVFCPGKVGFEFYV
jgi:hypothetical protein